MMKLERIWQERRNRYLREVVPYWRYVMSSGGLVMGFVFIMAVQGYASLLADIRRVGEASPAVPLAAAVIVALCLLWNPIRTYLQQPDLVFLMPQEGRMNDYFLNAWRSGVAASGGITVIALALYWPIYHAAHLGDGSDYAFAAACLLLLKGLLYYGAWKEKQFRYRGDRMAFGIAKTVPAVSFCYALAKGAFSFDLAWFLLVWASYAVALRIPAAYRVHWEHLLHLENRTVALHEAWFSLFIDLPHRSETFKPRTYLNGLLRLVKYRKENAYLYLFWRTFLRSSLFVIALRLIIVGILFMWAFPVLWLTLAIYVLFCWLLVQQLRNIAAISTDPYFALVSPLPDALRERSLRSVLRTSAGAGTVLLGLPLLFIITLPYAVGCILAVSGAAYALAGRKRAVAA